MALNITIESVDIVSQKSPADLIHRGDLQPVVNDLLKIKAAAGTGAGSGNVTSITIPSVDNTLVRYDGVTGLSVQGSPATLSDAGTFNIPAGQTYNINGTPIGTGNVSGSGASTAGTLPIVNDLTTTALIPSLVGITAAGEISIPAGQQVITPRVRGISSSNLELITDSGGEVIINDSGNNAANAIGIDTSGTGGYFKLKPGGVGGVALGWAADQGIYQVSGTQIGISVAGALQTTFSSVVGGIQVGAIGELVGGVGVTFPNDIHANSIKDNGNDIVIDQTLSGGKLTLQTLDGLININSGLGIGITAALNTNIDLTVSGAGSIIATSAAGAIVLTPNTGWTACTGTENKAGIDSNNVIFTVGALQDLARTVAAIQNVLMLKGYLVA